MIKKKWYILLYHGVGWEDPLVTKYISSMHSPDVFREHVNEVSKLGDILSFQDAIDYMKNKNNNRPAFTFWFDDGLTSVRKYALPILSKYASAVQSVCSDFFYIKIYIGVQNYQYYNILMGCLVFEKNLESTDFI